MTLETPPSRSPVPRTGEDMGMLTSYVALTALTDQITIEELARVAAALQIQVTRDFAPLWQIDAVIAAAAF
jgi:hypothetical protein